MRVFRDVLLGAGVLAILVAAQSFARADSIHRYSFTSDASDSVGGRNGTLVGDAAISGGAVQLDGTGDCVNLNGNDLASQSAVTIEVWGTYATTCGPNSRIFDFGSYYDADAHFFMASTYYTGLGKYNVGVSKVPAAVPLNTGTASFLAVTTCPSGNSLTLERLAIAVNLCIF